MKQRIVILGAGESGVGAAILAQRQGYDVFVSDAGTIAQRYRDDLDAHAIEWEEGGHTMAKVLAADEIVKSPGIARTAPVVEAVARQGIAVVSEIEFAGRYTASRMICITGSNGKTTTTKLTQHILAGAGIDAALAGNVGRSLARQVAEEPHAVYVVELSSFQLEDMYTFRADTAVVLNITPDHLDRYGGSMHAYAAAKLRILQNQRPTDHFIYWADDTVLRDELRSATVTAATLPFTDSGTAGCAAAVADGVMSITSPQSLVVATSDLALNGRHNMYNSMAAALAAMTAGADVTAIKAGLASFPGVEHRLEKVGVFDGVTYINDSKATNVDACWYALESMTTPTVLILGGTDKGNDYEAIREMVRSKCVALVYLGADNAKLHRFFDPLGLPVADTHSMADCVAACKRMARAGQTVLLSPCCASFDLFHNMAERGRMFKDLVKSGK